MPPRDPDDDDDEDEDEEHEDQHDEEPAVIENPTKTNSGLARPSREAGAPCHRREPKHRFPLAI